VVDSIPESPGEIYGPTDVCHGEETFIYSIDPVPGASFYTWVLPPGAIGVSTTNQIVVYFGEASQSGNLSVWAENDCGISQLSSVYITVTPLPGDAGPIEGLSQVCEGEDNVYYSISSISNVTEYIWSLPPGAVGESNTHEILVSFLPGSASGIIAVYGINPCGAGEISMMEIVVNPLPGNAGTTYGDTIVCEGQEDVFYYIDPILFATERTSRTMFLL